MTERTGPSIEATIYRVKDGLLAWSAAHPVAVAVALIALVLLGYGIRLNNDGKTFLDEKRARKGETFQALGAVIFAGAAWMSGLLDPLIATLLH